MHSPIVWTFSAVIFSAAGVAVGCVAVFTAVFLVVVFISFFPVLPVYFCDNVGGVLSWVII